MSKLARAHFSLLLDTLGWGERTHCFHKRRMKDIYLLSVDLLFMAEEYNAINSDDFLLLSDDNRQSHKPLKESFIKNRESVCVCLLFLCVNASNS